MSITSLFDLPFVDVWEYTPQGNQMPPPLGGGTVRKIRKGVYADKSYYYAWDGKHEGGEWEVYAKSDKAHVGVADPATGGWHAKKGSKPGRSIQVFAVSMRAGGAVAFGPVFVDASSLQDIESAIVWRSAPRAHITTLLEEAGIVVPRGLRWSYIVGNELTTADVERLLAEMIEGLNNWVGARSERQG